MNLESISERLADALRAAILTEFGHAADRVIMQTPPRLAMGDLATPVALELAKALKRAPRQIAESLVKHIELPPLVKSASVEGAGYINFRVDRGAFTAAHLRSVMSPPEIAGEHVIVEHTNINPNKAAHIGHLRNAVLGDTLVRCLKWLGNRVETQNYIDDTGVQVADVVVGIERILGQGIDFVRERIADPSEKFDFYCWDLYSRVGALYEQNKDALEWRRNTLHAIEHHEGEVAQLAALLAEAVVRRHIQTMWRLGIQYDAMTKESDILKMHFWDRAFELLKASGAVIYETEGKHAGCWVMKLTDSPEFEGLEEPDKILVRSNGTVTYVGKDIAYQLWKFGLLGRSFGYREFHRYPDGHVVWESASDGSGSGAAPHFGGAEKVYNVIDIRQAYLQKIVKEGLRLLGHAKEAESSIHFSYEMVALTPATAAALGMKLSDEDQGRAYVEMSGRRGLGVKADDLLDALESKATEAVREGLAEDQVITDAEASTIGHQIAVAALRYFMLKYGRNKVIAFDFEEALAFEGDSGPYLQYSTVRAENIFRKMSERGVDAHLSASEIDDLTIGEDIPDDLWEIIRGSAETATAVRRAVEGLEFSTLTHHAFELAQRFNSFYHKYPILNEAHRAERQRRAACAEVFRQTMHGILGLLGIAVPNRM